MIGPVLQETIGKTHVAYLGSFYTMHTCGTCLFDGTHSLELTRDIPAYVNYITKPYFPVSSFSYTDHKKLLTFSTVCWP